MVFELISFANQFPDERYLCDLYCRNRRSNTLEHNYTSISLFPEFLKGNGITYVEEAGRKDIAAFIEFEQDRDLASRNWQSF
ncbi:MAG: hypothetical protein ACLQBD_17635 [Syntrophobacteraceae bacterium]